MVRKGQGQGRIKQGQQTKMLHECRATHVLRAIWNAEIHGDIHFKFWVGKCQCRSNKVIEIESFLTNINNLYDFVSRLQNIIQFYLQLEILKIG